MLKIQKQSVILSLACLAVFSAMIFAVWYSFIKIKKASDDFLFEREKTMLLETQSGKVEEFKALYGEYLPNLEKVSKMFVDPKNPLPFIEFLEKTSAGLGLKTEMSPISPLKDSNPPALLIRAVLYGKFQDSVNFIKILENGPYLISVQNLTMSDYSDPKDKSREIKTTITLKVLATQ